MPVTVEDHYSSINTCTLLINFFFLLQPTFAMLHAVTNLFLATRSNECTLFATLWAMIASPQPKSATTCDVGLKKGI